MTCSNNHIVSFLRIVPDSSRTTVTNISSENNNIISHTLAFLSSIFNSSACEQHQNNVSQSPYPYSMHGQDLSDTPDYYFSSYQNEPSLLANVNREPHRPLNQFIGPLAAEHSMNDMNIS